ncbi:ArpU family phage packaging/lysis transcriptional regulator [Mesobacillus subterraneus]|uniref:ArpU family phage packaging/lysis transcriptional regulator n=1 Tax=Mesobacillus subterraneus TaxID=285983 RepID=UPI001CFC8E35|nr:ArpU family phage packaging/lysis transcriptional regulator [Mesobacillus subterraneus]WLR53566.1 ArpU family phage packaging/lysis transcriptional regulator [Mesobacillus subterraneus]
MGKQVLFKLPEIDRKQTQQNVENAIETYRMYLMTVPEERLPKVTASYSLIPPSNTNGFHSTTEDIAIHQVDQERECVEYVERFRKAVNRLSPKEREAVIMRYLGDEELYDYEVYNAMGMSESYYHQKFKPRIFYKLALALKIEVYKKKEV